LSDYFVTFLLGIHRNLVWLVNHLMILGLGMSLPKYEAKKTEKFIYKWLIPCLFSALVAAYSFFLRNEKIITNDTGELIFIGLITVFSFLISKISTNHLWDQKQSSRTFEVWNAVLLDWEKKVSTMLLMRSRDLAISISILQLEGVLRLTKDTFMDPLTTLKAASDIGKKKYPFKEVLLLNRINPIEWNTPQFRLYSLILHDNIRKIKVPVKERISVLDDEEFCCLDPKSTEVELLSKISPFTVFLAENYLWGIDHYVVKLSDFLSFLKEYRDSHHVSESDLSDKIGFLLAGSDKGNIVFEGTKYHISEGKDEKWIFPSKSEPERYMLLRSFFYELKKQAVQVKDIPMFSYFS